MEDVLENRRTNTGITIMTISVFCPKWQKKREGSPSEEPQKTLYRYLTGFLELSCIIVYAFLSFENTRKNSFPGRKLRLKVFVINLSVGGISDILYVCLMCRVYTQLAFSLPLQLAHSPQAL